MKAIYFQFFLLVLCNQPMFSQCVIDSSQLIPFSFEDHEYYVVLDNKSWVDAAACAVGLDGYLVEINSQEEQDTLFAAIESINIDPTETIAPDGGGGSYLWIGANDMANNGVWIWDGDNDGVGVQFWQGQANGNPVDDLYNNWGIEPDFQDAVGIAITNWPLGVISEWNDVFSTNELYFVVEKNELASSLSSTYESRISFYPNPFINHIKVSNPDGLFAKLIVYNSVSQIILQEELNENNIIDSSSWQKGMYIIRVADHQGNLLNRVLIK